MYVCFSLQFIYQRLAGFFFSTLGSQKTHISLLLKKNHCYETERVKKISQHALKDAPAAFFPDHVGQYFPLPAQTTVKPSGSLLPGFAICHATHSASAYTWRENWLRLAPLTECLTAWQKWHLSNFTVRLLGNHSEETSALLRLIKQHTHTHTSSHSAALIHLFLSGRLD